jgi:hypothetical protein
MLMNIKKRLQMEREGDKNLVEVRKGEDND